MCTIEPIQLLHEVTSHVVLISSCILMQLHLFASYEVIYLEPCSCKKMISKNNHGAYDSLASSIVHCSVCSMGTVNNSDKI